VRGFLPRGAAGVHSHLTLSPASHHPTNLSDNPPAGKGLCCLSPLAREAPSEPPEGAYYHLRHHQHRHAARFSGLLPDVSSDVWAGVPLRCYHRGGTWALGPHHHLPCPPSLHNLTPFVLHTTVIETHMLPPPPPLPTHDPWPPRAMPSSAQPWYSPYLI
jgi:hypothetical protein